MAFSTENCVGFDSSNAKKKLTRLGSFSSTEVFRVWAEDSLLKPTTIETLMESHEIDCLPAVLALRNRDFTSLGLPIGQARLFEDAVMKLHAEYEYQEPPSPATRVDIEFPRYKSLLEDKTEVVDGSPAKTSFQFTYSNGKHTDSVFNIMENGENFCDDDADSRTQEKLLHEREYDDETQSGCACERWLFVIIFMPLLLVVSLLGFITWIVVWPVDRFCLQGEKESFTISKTSEFLIKSPAKACDWAIGRRDRDLESVKEDETTKPSYGGTDVVHMKELEKEN